MNTRDTTAADAGKEHLQGQPARTDRLTTADVARAASARAEQPPESQGGVARAPSEGATPLFPGEVTDEFRSRWMQVQTRFVDTPREAVEQADELVADAIARLADSFSQERSRLEAQWARDGDVSTEDLRIALQRYRAFFQRLLQV